MDVERSGVRLADLVATFSLAMDLGLGQPVEHMLRSWLIASRVGEHIGLSEHDRAALYYVTTLGWSGCVADTPEVAAWFGDDIAARRDSFGVDRTGFSLLGFALQHAGSGGSALQRLRLIAALVATRGAPVERGLMAHCLTTASIADRLGLGTEVSLPLQQVFTRWDGRGVPLGIGGEEIAPTMRMFQLADTVEVVHRLEGVDAAVDIARSWSGSEFDPQVVDAFCRSTREVLTGLEQAADWGTLIDGEPALQHRMDDAELDRALEAVADFTDLRSRSRSGHSRTVARLAAEAGAQFGLPAADVVLLRRAGLLHDFGLHGVPATILDKPGPLRSAEWERVRMHAYYTERMLSRPPVLARIGSVAALVHERLDGSGYHRGLSGSAIPITGRILGAADAYAAMVEPRPYRPALSPTDATRALRAEVRAGRLASDAVDAVLAAAGQRRRGRSGGPAGLTSREVEVLVLIARGASNKQVARSLGISAKTAGTHIERIYAKTGASTRSTATLFAMQAGLLDSLEPFDS
ncbi:MAG: HD domain-containing protein [Acidimicrobiales bacterium]|nr:HD domain-containing protein [Acidimicrobiales bacterium]